MLFICVLLFDAPLLQQVVLFESGNFLSVHLLGFPLPGLVVLYASSQPVADLRYVHAGEAVFLFQRLSVVV